MELTPKRGGFKRTWLDGSPRLVGPFIFAHLPGTGHEIYTAYKNAVREQPSGEFLASARRRARRTLTRLKRTRLHERVSVSREEVEVEVQRMLSARAVLPIRGGKRCMNYNSFMHYIYILHQLGLIEYTGEEETAAGKAGSITGPWHETHPAVMLRAGAGTESDPAWQNPWAAYREER